MTHSLRMRIARWLARVAVATVVLVPAPALAQQSDEWQVNFAPFFFWATELNGSMTVRNTTIPITKEVSR